MQNEARKCAYIEVWFDELKRRRPYKYFMDFYPLYEGLNNYFLTTRRNHERLKKNFARPWGNEGLVYYLHAIVPHERLA